MPGSVSNNSVQPPIGAIVVTFFPDVGLGARIAKMAVECDRVIVVDNGSDLAALLLPNERVEILPQSSNLGLAAALNIGLRRAIALGYDWAVTYDQDSTPGNDMVKKMWATHERYPDAAVVGPRIAEEGLSETTYRWIRRHPQFPGFFQRVGCTDIDRADITLLISSGSLIDLRVWNELRGFDEDLFIDYIDTDYCLRVHRSGRSLAVSAAARMEHRLGQRRTDQLLGIDFSPMHHPAFRHYYIARNRVRLWRRYALAVPHWALFDFAFTCLNGFRVMAFEREKWLKFKAMIFGTWDGLRGQGGACPDRRVKALKS